MIDVAMLTEVCGDPAKKDATLLWFIYWDMRWLGPNNTEEIGSYESRIIANSSGYTIHSEGERIVEVYRNASPYSNLQAAAEKVRTAHTSDVYDVKAEGCTVEQYIGVLGPRNV